MDTKKFIQQMVDEVAGLRQEVDQLKQRRVSQTAIIPGAVQTRHMGSGNAYVLSGLDADLPDGATVTASSTAYFATDTLRWYIFDGSQWRYVVLT